MELVDLYDENRVPLGKTVWSKILSKAFLLLYRMQFQNTTKNLQSGEEYWEVDWEKKPKGPARRGLSGPVPGPSPGKEATPPGGAAGGPVWTSAG